MSIPLRVRELLLTLACLLLIGCGDANRAKLVGIWSIEQPDKVIKRLDGIPDDNAAKSPTPPKMQIQFLRNGQLTTITQMGSVAPNPKQGNWEMLAFDESNSKMTIKCQIGLQESEHEIEFLDEDTIKLVPPNLAGLSLQLKFQRQ